MRRTHVAPRTYVSYRIETRIARCRAMAVQLPRPHVMDAHSPMHYSALWRRAPARRYYSAPTRAKRVPEVASGTGAHGADMGMDRLRRKIPGHQSELPVRAIHRLRSCAEFKVREDDHPYREGAVPVNAGMRSTFSRRCQTHSPSSIRGVLKGAGITQSCPARRVNSVRSLPYVHPAYLGHVHQRHVPLR